MSEQRPVRVCLTIPLVRIADVDPMRHRVLSCRLIPRGERAEEHRAWLIEHHVWRMRWVAGSRQRLERFFSETVLIERTALGLLTYFWRSIRLAMAAELVLITTPQARVEFLAEFLTGVIVRLRGRQCLLYSEVWGERPGWRNAARRAALRLTFQLASEVVVPGSRHALSAASLVGAGTPVRVVGSPYCDPPATVPLIRPHTPLRLLYCGRIFPLKGLDVLVDAVHWLLKNGREDIELTVVDVPQSQWAGKDRTYRDRCLHHARELLGDRLTVIGPVRAVEELFATHDVLVMPNREVRGDRVPVESWGRILEESLTCGCPVVASDTVGAAHDLIESGVNGFIVPSEDVQSLADALEHFMHRDAHHAT